jgi:nucleotide-binding universal stress UspA family protein
MAAVVGQVATAAPTSTMSAESTLATELAVDLAEVVVCGVDGSDDCVEIARIAIDVSRRLGGRAELVHALDGGERPAAAAMLDALCQSSQGDVTARLVELGDPALALTVAADSLQATLIVVASGGVSERVIAAADCPVLVVPRALRRHVRPLDWWPCNIVCGFDGSEAAWAAAMHAAMLAHPTRGSVTLVSVGASVDWRMSSVASTLQAKLAESGAFDPCLPAPQVGWALRDGDPARELEQVARATAAPLIAVGSRGSNPPRDRALGSLTRGLLKSSSRPVVVTPAAAPCAL